MKRFPLFLAMIGISASGAWAQNSGSDAIVRIDQSEDWSVYRSVSEPRECGVIARPRKTVNTRNGQPASVRRGEILLAVTVTPNGQYSQLVSFQGGYPFAEGSTVDMTIGNREFRLGIGVGEDGEWAWPSEGEDKPVVDAMKNGRDAVLVGRSQRGTVTTDTFSLLGLTVGLALAENCASKL